MVRKPAALAAAAVLALAMPATGLAAGNAGFGPPSSASPQGDTISFIYWVVFSVCAVVFVLVESMLVLFVLRFRRRRGAPRTAEGPQIHGNTRLEIIWTIIPAVALLGLAVFTVVKLPGVRGIASAATGDAPLRVRVEAHQFYWEYKYEPSGVVALDTLRLPVGRPVSLEITTRDVDHSWWVPEITGKLDAIAGRVNTLDFTPDRVGRFTHGKCAELCGAEHAMMTTTVEVIPPAEFQRWLGQQGAVERAARPAFGRSTFMAVCGKCHGLSGEGGGYGPRIRGNGTLTSRGALLRLVSNGQDTSTFPGYMPPVGRGWPRQQFNALFAYLQSNKTLTSTQGGGTGGGTG